MLLELKLYILLIFDLVSQIVPSIMYCISQGNNQTFLSLTQFTVDLTFLNINIYNSE